MIYQLIAAAACIIVAAFFAFSIPEHGGDGYMGQGLMAAFSFMAGVALLALGALVWLYNHLAFV